MAERLPMNFTGYELRAIVDIVVRHSAYEVEVTDHRPDAECLVVKALPSGDAYCLDDMGTEIDAPLAESDGLPVLVFSVKTSAPSPGGDVSGRFARDEPRRACQARWR